MMDVVVDVPKSHGYRKVSTLVDFFSSLLRIVRVSSKEERIFLYSEPTRCREGRPIRVSRSEMRVKD